MDKLDNGCLSETACCLLEFAEQARAAFIPENGCGCECPGCHGVAFRLITQSVGSSPSLMGERRAVPSAPLLDKCHPSLMGLNDGVM